MLGKSRKPVNQTANASIEWDLYEFFRAPGIYYYSDGALQQWSRFGSGPSMKPKIYGYRLGTREEVDVFKA